MSSDKNSALNYGEDKNIGLELVFCSAAIWFVVLMGFKLNSVYDVLNFEKLEFSYFLFVMSLFTYFLIALILSYKLAIKYLKLEFIFVIIFAMANGVIFNALLTNMMLKNNMSVEPIFIGYAFCGAMLFSTLIVTFVAFIEQRVKVQFSYLVPFSSILAFGFFFFVLSFYVNDIKEITKYLAFVFPLMIINSVYSGTIYQAYRASTTYVNLQLVNISSIIFVLPLFVVSLMCF